MSQNKSKLKSKLSVKKSYSSSYPIDIPDDYKNELKDAFKSYDIDNKGFITRAATRCILQNFCFAKMNGRQIEEQLQLDDECVGKENRQQFYYDDIFTIFADQWLNKGGKEQELKECFEVFDLNGDGKVTKNEIKRIFDEYLDVVVTEEEIEEFIAEQLVENQELTIKNFQKLLQ